MNRYKKWLKYTVINVIVGFSIVVIFNYKIDSAGIFTTDSCLYEAAGFMAKGSIVAGLGDEAFDGRRFQIFFIKQIEEDVKTIVLGSSRTKELRARYLNKLENGFYNHAVNGASLQDYIAIIGAYKQLKGYIPKNIIIGIDPWAFNKNSGRNRWESISEYYDYIMPFIVDSHIENSEFDQSKRELKQLLNFDYTLTNIKYLYRRIKHREKPFYIVKSLDIDDYLREPDGSIHYPNSINNITQEKLFLEAKKYTQGNIYSLENYKKLEFLDDFHSYMKYLKEEGVKVTFFLPPYNNMAYDILKENKKYKINEVEHYLRTYSSENNITLIGSYNPYNLDLNNMDFFDGMHVKDNGIEKIFKNFDNPL